MVICYMTVEYLFTSLIPWWLARTSTERHLLRSPLEPSEPTDPAISPGSRFLHSPILLHFEVGFIEIICEAVSHRKSFWYSDLGTIRKKWELLSNNCENMEQGYTNIFLGLLLKNVLVLS